MAAKNMAEFLEEKLGHAPEAYTYANFGSHGSYILGLLLGPVGAVMNHKKRGVLVLDGKKLHYFTKAEGDFDKGTFTAEKSFTLDLAQVQKAKNLKIGVVDYLTLTKGDGEKMAIQINRFMKVWNKDQAADADKIKAAVGA